MLGTQSYGFQPFSPASPHLVFHSLTGLGNTSALCQAPSPSFIRAYNLAEETNTQQIITMQGVECDSGDRHNAVRAQVGGLELNPLSQGEFLEE